jgi:hypothetical protein
VIDVHKLAAGEELDALIAEKVMGWTLHVEERGPFMGELAPDGKLRLWVKGNECKWNVLHWKPSTDIAAALEVVESPEEYPLRTDRQRRTRDDRLVVDRGLREPHERVLRGRPPSRHLPCGAPGGGRMKVQLVAPSGRRRLWRVKTPHGYYTCDSEEIARLVAKRLSKNQHPGWAAHDLRHGRERF